MRLPLLGPDTTEAIGGLANEVGARFFPSPHVRARLHRVVLRSVGTRVRARAALKKEECGCAGWAFRLLIPSV